MNEIAVVIPTFNPTNKLVELLEELTSVGIENIYVVNDGSDSQSHEILNKVSRMPVSLSHLEYNQGKGFALKYVLEKISLNPKGIKYIITCDDDFQHHPSDIQKLISTILKSDFNGVFLGVRDFNSKVPLKSKLGNKSMQLLFYLKTRTLLKDTQTGLRGYPLKLISNLLMIPENRFDFEFSALVYIAKMKLLIREIPIETIYFDRNLLTRFSPLKDSISVLRVLLK